MKARVGVLGHLSMTPFCSPCGIIHTSSTKNTQNFYSVSESCGTELGGGNPGYSGSGETGCGQAERGVTQLWCILQNSPPVHQPAPAHPIRQLCLGCGAPKTSQAFLHLGWAVPLSLKLGVVWMEGKEPGVVGGMSSCRSTPWGGASPIFQACVDTARSESHAGHPPSC